MESPEQQPNAPASPAGRVPSRLALIALGLVAGLLATAGGEATYPAFHTDLIYPANFSTLTGAEKTAVRGQVRLRARMTDETRKAMAAFGLLGAMIGAVLGLGGGLAGGSTRSGVEAAVVGAIWGVAAGAGLSRILVPVFFEISDSQTGVPLLLVIHWAIFASLAIVGGWALAWGTGSRDRIVRSIIGAFLAVLFGTLVIDVINFVAFPLYRTHEPVPVKSLARLLLNTGVAIAVAAGAALALRKRR